MSEQQPSEASSGDRRYRLLERIGRGGFGSVFRGRLIAASGFEKDVAIKVLHLGAPGQGEFAARMRDEARMLALLRHRAIVGVEDLLTIGDQVAIVMELIEGADLASLLKLGPVPPRAAVEIAREAAWALAAAHSALDPATGLPLQLVHRDVKPANIRVTPTGDVKVMDFGVAHARFQERESRTDSLSFGSWGYMAPERFDDQESAASDVYALGAVLFESIAGVRLKQLSVNPEKHRSALVRAMHAVNVESLELLAIIERMMSYEVGERPTALETASTLRSLAPSLPGAWLNEWIPDALQRLAAEAPDTVLLPNTGSDPHLRPPSLTGSLPPAPSPLPLTPGPLAEAGPFPEEGADISGPCLSGSFHDNLLPAPAEAVEAAPAPAFEAAEAAEAAEAPDEAPLERRSSGATRAGIALGALIVVVLGLLLMGRAREGGAPTGTATSTVVETPRPGVAGEEEGLLQRAGTPAGPEAAPPSTPPLETSAPATAARPTPREATSRPSAPPEASPSAPEIAPLTPSALEAASPAPPEPAPEAPAPAQAPEQSASAPSSLSGSWQGEALGRPLTLRLSFDDHGAVSGTTRARLGAEEVARSVRGTFDAGSGVITLSESGSRAVTYTGRVADGRVSGQVLVAGKARGDWTAQLQAP